MWLKHPGKVKGLVLVSATPRMMEEPGGTGGGWRGMNERRLAALRLGTALTFKDDPSPMYDRRNMDRGLEFLRQTDLRAALLDFSSRMPRPPSPPVAIFQSERDGIVRPQNAEFLKRVFPQAKVTMVPGGEHVLPIAIPELIDESVFDIIKQNEFQA